MSEQKQKEIRRRLDAELSDIHWTGLNSRAVKNAVENGGKIMKKKISTAFALVVALMLATIGALAAAGVLFSEKADVAKQADKALESAYGITPAIHAYFTSTVEENGKTVVRNTSYDVFSYVLKRCVEASLLNAPFTMQKPSHGCGSAMVRWLSGLLG